MNKKLLKEHHSFDVRNTNTKFDDEAMQLSLTYFAVINNKPVFAIESSKNLSLLSQKVFYQLRTIEKLMNIVGTTYTKKFRLDKKNLNKIIKNYGKLRINGNFPLNLTNIKKSLSFIPIESKSNVFKFSNPLGSIVKRRKIFTVLIRKVLTLKPQYFKMAATCVEKFDVIIGGNIVSLNETSDIVVIDDFNIVNENSYRVNVIWLYIRETPK